MANFYRDLVQILRENGFEFLRPGKGSHEMVQRFHQPARHGSSHHKVPAHRE